MKKSFPQHGMQHSHNQNRRLRYWEIIYYLAVPKRLKQRLLKRNIKSLCNS